MTAITRGTTSVGTGSPVVIGFVVAAGFDEGEGGGLRDGQAARCRTRSDTELVVRHSVHVYGAERDFFIHQRGREIC